MKSLSLAAFACIYVICQEPVLSQTAPPVANSAQQPSVSSAVSSNPAVALLQPAAGENILRVGTPVPLRTREELTTKGKKLRVGQRFNLEVAENVLVHDTVVIPAGSPAVGEITDVRNKGMWGKSGHFAASILYVMVNGRQIRLSGVFDDKGTAGGIGATAVSAVVFLPAGFFMTGTSAKIPMGAAVQAFADEDVPFAIAAPAAPMIIPAAQPANPAATDQHGDPAPAAAKSNAPKS